MRFASKVSSSAAICEHTDEPSMQSLLVYMQWISKDIPIYSKLPWALPASLENQHKPDAAAGEKVYASVCARCHGETGQGTPIAPPLWGQGSYNDGAGMPYFRLYDREKLESLLNTLDKRFAMSSR